MRIVIEIDQAGTAAPQVLATSDTTPTSDTGQSPGPAAPINAGAAPSRLGAVAAVALSDTGTAPPGGADAGQAISAGPPVLPA